MHFNALTAVEQRILGCLVEKRFTTPDQYPLSLNALRLAANQSTNRDPVVNYDEHTVNEAAQRLSRYGLARLASGHSSRTTKYRHLAEESLGVNQSELALLCVLLLRGPQTPGELKTRTERLAPFASLEAVDAGLEQLVDKRYVQMIGRRPGQKEDRWAHLLGGEPEPAGDSAPQPAEDGAPPAAPSVGASRIAAPTATDSAGSELEARVAKLEAEVAELRALIED